MLGEQKPSIVICSAYRSLAYVYARRTKPSICICRAYVYARHYKAEHVYAEHRQHYKAHYKDARQYNANRLNLLVTPGAARFEPLKLMVRY